MEIDRVSRILSSINKKSLYIVHIVKPTHLIFKEYKKIFHIEQDYKNQRTVFFINHTILVTTFHFIAKHNEKELISIERQVSISIPTSIELVTIAANQGYSKAISLLEILNKIKK